MADEEGAVASSSRSETPPTSMRPQSLSSIYRPRSAFSFPRAAQPEIVRAYQKDVYYRDLLQTQVQDVVRSLLGSRALFAHTSLINFMGSVTYFTLSTLGGAQTLGEEYVNIMMVEGKTRRIVGLGRRFAFILFHIISPFFASRGYAALRRRIIASDQIQSQSLQRARLRATAVAPRTANQSNSTKDEPQPSTIDRIVSFMAAKMPSIDSISSSDGLLTYLSAAHLALFYLGGKYYSVGQRMSRTEYISTIARRPGAKPPSYEVLGFLLAVQLAVKALLQANRWRTEVQKRKSEQAAVLEQSSEMILSEKISREDASTVEIDDIQWSHKTSPPTLVTSTNVRRFVPLTYPDPDALPSAQDLGLPKDISRNQLEAARTAAKIRAAELEAVSESILKCTLCMERREPQKGTSAVTECGHVFCWDCILGWNKEKAECPLCRQSLNPSHLLPLYNF